MQGKNIPAGFSARLGLMAMAMAVILSVLFSCGNRSAEKKIQAGTEMLNGIFEDNDSTEESTPVYALLVSPEQPYSGQSCRVLATGGKKIRKARITVSGPSGKAEIREISNGDGRPYWRIDEFTAATAGQYKVELFSSGKIVAGFEFTVTAEKPTRSAGTERTVREWSGETEALYAAWINALFKDATERNSWSALHEVTRQADLNFLHNYLSLGEDEASGKQSVIMEPDCADNPFYFRAYFAWKLGLPFGYHECDRGMLSRAPKTGNWITNQASRSKISLVPAFNSLLRRVMNGVHSGTARTSLKNENTDYYPVPLTRETLRPGVVFADPYGHTLILVRWIPQETDKPGVLLSVDAQPDGTVGIKRFWKGNFLFSTTDVIGEPGFKAFRPIITEKGQFRLMKNSEISARKGLLPFSLEQEKMQAGDFYHTIERIINPQPMDPEIALLDLIEALHEQLTVRITSVANGEAYMKSHPGEVIAMPGGLTGVFQAGGSWEDFSTPNRDLRLLIAMDAVIDFPDRIVRTPEDFSISGFSSPEKVKNNLVVFLQKKLSERSITYTRTDGSQQTLTLAEILQRRDAFEMAYNPNDCIEARWGAPQNSDEYATCKRHAPPGQLAKMKKVRVWFQKRLHPPT